MANTLTRNPSYLTSPLTIDSSATNQLKIQHNANDYATLTVADTGDLTIATVGDGTLDSDMILDVDGKLTLDTSGAVYLKNGNLSDSTYLTITVGTTPKIAANYSGADLELSSATNGDLILTALGSGDCLFGIGGEIDFNTTTCGFTAQTGTDAVSIDWGEGNKYHLLLENSSTVTFATNPTNPCNLLLKVQQGGGGSKVITWAVTSGTIYWPGGGILDTDKPTLTTADDETDILSFYFDGTNYFGVASLGFDTPSP